MATEGTNFGLNDNFRYLEIELDSLDASTSSDAYFDYTDWPLFQFITPLKGLAAVKVIEVQIPFSFYVFNNSNNTFLLTESDGVTNSIVTIPIGNYNSTTLSTQLGSSLTSAGTHTYTVTFAGQTSTPSTGKFTITSNDATPGATFTLTFGTFNSNPTLNDRGVTNPRLFLGFAGGDNTSSAGPTPVLVAPNVALISGPNYLYLNSRFLGPSVSTILPAGAVGLGGGSVGPQIAKIPINVQPGGTIYWSDPDPLYWFPLENLGILTQLDLYITVGNNARPTVTRLNGQGFSVKLGILLNKEITGKLQGQDGSFPASTLSLPRKRVLF